MKHQVQPVDNDVTKTPAPSVKSDQSESDPFDDNPFEQDVSNNDDSCSYFQYADEFFENQDEIDYYIRSPPPSDLQASSDERQFAININEANQGSTIRRRSHKKIIPLHNDGKRYKRHFYRKLNQNDRKTARKELVLKYHNIARQRNPRIRRVLRDEYRNINNYFNNFADQEILIMQTIQELIDEGIIDYDGDYRSLTQ